MSDTSNKERRGCIRLSQATYDNPPPHIQSILCQMTFKSSVYPVGAIEDSPHGVKLIGIHPDFDEIEPGGEDVEYHVVKVGDHWTVGRLADV